MDFVEGSSLSFYDSAGGIVEEDVTVGVCKERGPFYAVIMVFLENCGHDVVWWCCLCLVRFSTRDIIFPVL